MNTLSIRRWTIPLALALLAGAALLTAVPPALAGSCHAHSHAHDQCAWQTRSRTRSGGSVSCDANSNTPGVHSHAFGVAECFLFFCNKVVGGHHWWQNGCGSKHAWWHARAGTGRFMVLGEGDSAEIELVIPAEAPPETLPPPTTGRAPVENGLARQGLIAGGDAVVNVRVEIGVRTADGRVLPLLEGRGALGGPGSQTPGFRSSDVLGRLLRKESRSDDERAGLTRASVLEDFVGERIKVPTNQELELLFDLQVDVGGDDPEEADVPSVKVPEGDRAGTAASLAASVRLADRSGRYVLKVLDDEERDERKDESGRER